jgi:hypothetical protein
MSAKAFDIKRRADGSIDTDIYARRSVQLRQIAIRMALRRIRRLFGRRAQCAPDMSPRTSFDATVESGLSL